MFDHINQWVLFLREIDGSTADSKTFCARVHTLEKVVIIAEACIIDFSMPMTRHAEIQLKQRPLSKDQLRKLRNTRLGPR